MNIQMKDWQPQVERFQDLPEYMEYLKTNIPDRNIHHGRHEIKTVKKKAGKGEIPIGSYDADYTTGLKTISILGESLRLLISGSRAGCGKTTFLSNIMIDGINLYLEKNPDDEIGRIVYDFKNEIISRRKPAHQFTKKISKIDYPGFQPKGCNKIVQVAPYFLKDLFIQEYQDEEYYTQYDTDNMTISDIEKLFRIDNQSRNPTYEKERNLLHRIVYGGFSDDNRYGHKNHVPSEKILEVFNEGLVKNDGLKTKISNLITVGALGNEHNNCDLIELLNDGYVVCYLTAKKDDAKRFSHAYVGIEMQKIIRARDNYRKKCMGVHNAGDEDVLNNKVIMYLPEFDNYMPKGASKPTTKMVLRDIYNEERYNAISVFADTPSFNFIDDLSMEQSHYIFSFRISPKQAGNLKKVRYLTDTHLNDLFNLNLDRYKHPNECAVIDDDVDRYGHLETFYPLPPLSNPQSSVYRGKRS